MDLTAAKLVLEKFNVDEEFSSHDFIEKYSTEYESDYIDMLFKYQSQNDNRAFQTVHAIIGRFLETNAEDLIIKKTNRKESENVHGNKCNPQWWRKLNS